MMSVNQRASPAGRRDDGRRDGPDPLPLPLPPLLPPPGLILVARPRMRFSRSPTFWLYCSCSTTSSASSMPSFSSAVRRGPTGFICIFLSRFCRRSRFLSAPEERLRLARFGRRPSLIGEDAASPERLNGSGAAPLIFFFEPRAAAAFFRLLAAFGRRLFSESNRFLSEFSRSSHLRRQLAVAGAAGFDRRRRDALEDDIAPVHRPRSRFKFRTVTN